MYRFVEDIVEDIPLFSLVNEAAFYNVVQTSTHDVPDAPVCTPFVLGWGYRCVPLFSVIVNKDPSVKSSFNLIIVELSR